jgi:hypothetical protein
MVNCHFKEDGPPCLEAEKMMDIPEGDDEEDETEVRKAIRSARYQRLSIGTNTLHLDQRLTNALATTFSLGINNDFGTERQKHHTTCHRHGLRHGQDAPVPLLARDEGQRNAQVPNGRIDQHRLAWVPAQPIMYCANPVSDRPARSERFEFAVALAAPFRQTCVAHEITGSRPRAWIELFL